MKFICKNPNCSKFNVEYEYLKNTYKMIDGQWRSNNAVCPKCGQLREEVTLSEPISFSEKNIVIAKYSSASKEEKSKILKKRSHEHFKKEIKPFKEYKLQQAIHNFKNIKKM